ncbi:hypothetical protein FRX31_022503 [Thalictrum thalictroides]|uniref:O-methyltransferase dimerisation domain-containing protein n=1 Tax=Thalictrum thalictroides TaxID=46969 RepID=A0A7J6VT19_THATH|nr:hypothetical protein FRX31_022503 [Thalictrum thalictroides]
MGELKEKDRLMVKEEEDAKVRVWKYVCGFVGMAVVKCAVEHEIFDFIENHGIPMTINELSAALACSSLFLCHIMRFLCAPKVVKRKVQQ